MTFPPTTTWICGNVSLIILQNVMPAISCICVPMEMPTTSGFSLLTAGRHELIADIAIDVHLLVVETGQQFFRDAGPVAQVAFHRIEHERSGIIGGGDVLHRLAEGIQRPFQLVCLIEAARPARSASPLRREPRDRTHRSSSACSSTAIWPASWSVSSPRFSFICSALSCIDCLALTQIRNSVVKKWSYISMLMSRWITVMAGFPQHGGQGGQGQIGRRRHPLGRKQQHDLGGLARAVLESAPGRRFERDLNS